MSYEISTGYRGSRDEEQKELVSVETQTVVALIDYENLVKCCLEEGFVMSFFKLRDYLRRYGIVEKAECYLPLHSAGFQTSQILYQAGFKVVVGQYGPKDKDSVDTGLKEEAKFLARHTTIGSILLISEDTDIVGDPLFLNGLCDMNKAIHTLNPRDLPKSLQDEEGVSELKMRDDRKQLFETVINATCSVPRLEDSHHAVKAFVDDVIVSINDLSTALSFLGMKKAVWDRLRGAWSCEYTAEALEDLLTVLNVNDVLESFQVKGRTRYRINFFHGYIRKINGQLSFRSS